MEETSRFPFPDEFVSFLQDNGVDPLIYGLAASAPRYIRLKPNSKVDVQELEAEFKCKIEKVGWLPDFLSLPSHAQIAKSKLYQGGQVYGIDAASGAAVSALNISVGDHVLDLCAAPGAKLCMILDLLGNSGSVTAVDIASHRLAACRTMVQKYMLGCRCRLFVADGTTFSLVPVRVFLDTKGMFGESELADKLDVFKEWTPKRTWKDRKIAKARQNFASQINLGVQDPELIFYGKDSGVVGLTRSKLYQTLCDSEVLTCGYDKFKWCLSGLPLGRSKIQVSMVLVDAECTHDGSIKHVQKFKNWGWETLQRRVLNAERTDELTILQLRLLSNGFRLLKAGGSLVYSTCSLTVVQNEDVVKQFLAENSNAELQEIDAAKQWPCKSGLIRNTLRFDPRTSGTSGLFVAKFTKLHM